MRQFCIPSFSADDYNFDILYYERYRYNYEKNFPKILHSHPFSEIIFVTDGKGYFHLSDKSFVIHKGDAIIINANIIHTESPFPDESLEYTVLGIEKMPFLINAKQTNENTFILHYDKYFEYIFNYIRKIEREWVVREKYWNQILQMEFNSMILFLLRHAELMPKQINNSKKPHHMAQIYSYMFAHYSEDINLEKLCAIFSVNKYTLSHLYKKEYGDTVINTLNRIRCQTAETQLQKSDKSVSDICFNVGYNSESYFCKKYKEIIGQTPLETRKSYFVESVKQPVLLEYPYY